MTLPTGVLELAPIELRELACLIEERQPERAAIRTLDDEGLEVLADLIATGQRPSVRFWRQYGRAR